MPILTDTLFDRVEANGGTSVRSRAVAEEMPVAVEPGGIGYAVLMATAADLEDLACGFAWSERLIDGPEQILEVGSHRTKAGVILRLALAPEILPRPHNRVRHEVSCQPL